MRTYINIKTLPKTHPLAALKVSTSRRYTSPLKKLALAQQLRACLLTPSNPDHDAHFVGIFLGMSQRHFYPVIRKRESRMSTEQGIPPCPEFHDLNLWILTKDTETSEFIVYKGNRTKEFLEKFHDPSKAPADDGEAGVSGLKIEYTRVPIWPILGLGERLGKALAEDVVGASDPEEMETWEK
ncbi:unnamed protein product, partial [Fusarium langsethiae]